MALAEGLVERAGELERIVADGSIDPAERVRRLITIRDGLKDAEGDPADVAALVGKADTYIGGLQLQREGAALGQVMARAIVSENADLRELLAEEGIPEEDLDALGLPSRAELDAAKEEGTLEEAFKIDVNLLRSLAAKRRRNRGQFADEFGPLGAAKPLKMKGRGGKSLDLPKPPKPPKSPALPQNPGVRDAPGENAQDIKMAQRFEQHAPPVAEAPGERLKAIHQKILDQGMNDWPEKGHVARRSLGTAKDTREKHTITAPKSPGTKDAPVYTAERTVVHDKLIGEELGAAVGTLLGENHPATKKLLNGELLDENDKKAVRAAASEARDGASAKALFMAGGPASGKSSALKVNPDLEPHAAVTINPDLFKEKLPEYQEMRAGKDRYAATGTHEESSDLGKRLSEEATDLGLNIVLDGTGDNPDPMKFAGKMGTAHEQGYEVSALYVTIPTDEAVLRATLRAMKSGRWVPEPELRAQHKNVSVNFEAVAQLDFLTDLKVYDNATPQGEDPIQIASGSGGSLHIDDEGRFTEFQAKAKE